MKTKIIIFTCLFFLLFYISLIIAGFLPFVAEYKTEISPSNLMNFLKDIILDPIEFIKIMHQDNNPLIYVSPAAALGLFIYLLIKLRKKNYENVGDKYAVHGSSRWAKKEEIFNVPDQITIVPSKDMYAELKKTLKNNQICNSSEDKSEM